MNNTQNMKSLLKSQIVKSFSYHTSDYDSPSSVACGLYPVTTAPIGDINSIEAFASGGNPDNSLFLTKVSSQSTPIFLYPTARGNLSTYEGIYLGSGTTPPTPNDIKLESPISSGLSFSSCIRNRELDENDNIYLKVQFTVTNTSDSTIQIAEIGLFTSAKETALFTTYKGTTPAGSNYRYNIPILIDRAVFDEPIILPAGEAAVIEYNITIDVTNI